jgi:hypothetical protein
VDWQSIETAPRDGTSILVWGIVWAEEGQGSEGKAIVSQAHFNPGNEHSKYEGSWFCDAQSYYNMTAEPTHWMRLPPAPGERIALADWFNAGRDNPSTE